MFRKILMKIPNTVENYKNCTSYMLQDASKLIYNITIREVQFPIIYSYAIEKELVSSLIHTYVYKETII